MPPLRGAITRCGFTRLPCHEAWHNKRIKETRQCNITTVISHRRAPYPQRVRAKKIMPRKQRTAEELQEASNHLHYELWMLSSLAQAIASGISNQGWLTNALLESFVVHVRGVMDFLYNDAPQKDDVVAQDYFASSDEWSDIRPKLSELLSKAKKRAGKEVAHLTYARLSVTPETKPWPFIDIANEITSIVEVFLNNVPREKLGSQWKRNAAP